MKKQLTFLATLLVLFSTLFFSCDKEDNPQQKTKTELLVSGSWKLKAATLGGADAMSYIQDCQKDNIITFSANGNGIAAEGLTKCNSGDPDNVSFTWSFQSNETILNVSVPLIMNGTNDMTINKLTEIDLIVTVAYNPPVGPASNLTLTFQH